MDRFRYVFGAFHVVVLPLGLLFWCVIHPWARFWRRLGPMRTYLVVLPPLAGCGAFLFRWRGWLLGADLGTSGPLILVACALYAVMTWLELQYWKRLSIATLVGITELRPMEAQEGKLLRDGIYRMVRHPRYLSAGIGVIANALVIDYAGLYVEIVLLFAAGHVLLVLEERELTERFGEEYRRYQREVPRILPRLRIKRA